MPRDVACVGLLMMILHSFAGGVLIQSDDWRLVVVGALVGCVVGCAIFAFGLSIRISLARTAREREKPHSGKRNQRGLPQQIVIRDPLAGMTQSQRERLQQHRNRRNHKKR